MDAPIGIEGQTSPYLANRPTSHSRMSRMINTPEIEEETSSYLGSNDSNYPHAPRRHTGEEHEPWRAGLRNFESHEGVIRSSSSALDDLNVSLSDELIGTNTEGRHWSQRHVRMDSSNAISDDFNIVVSGESIAPAPHFLDEHLPLLASDEIIAANSENRRFLDENLPLMSDRLSVRLTVSHLTASHVIP